MDDTEERRIKHGIVGRGARTENRPRFGFCLPAKILRAVDFPIPFVPTSPNTCPGLGTGNRCSLKEFAEYRCVVSFSKFVGKLTMEMASNGLDKKEKD